MMSAAATCDIEAEEHGTTTHGLFDGLFQGGVVDNREVPTAIEAFESQHRRKPEFVIQLAFDFTKRGTLLHINAPHNT